MKKKTEATHARSIEKSMNIYIYLSTAAIEYMVCYTVYNLCGLACNLSLLTQVSVMYYAWCIFTVQPISTARVFFYCLDMSFADLLGMLAYIYRISCWVVDVNL